MRFEIREFMDGDLPALARIYRATIEQQGSQYYSPEQVAAWASYPNDLAGFEAWIVGASTFVAMDARREPIGFGGLEPCGRVSSLFVSPQVARRGAGSALLVRLVSEISNRGIAEATTHASEFSRPLFEKFGFRVVGVEHTQVRGVDFTRYAMVLRVQGLRSE